MDREVCDDRVVLVTGGAQGIGFATASWFAQSGARLAILDRAGDAALAAAQSIGDGSRAIGIGVDVTDSDAVDAAIDRVVAEFGGLHVVVNNAGVTRDNLLFKMTNDEWDTVIAVHLRGTFTVCRAAQRHMVAQRSGRIVNLSSIAALGNRGQVNYSAAKAGIQGLTRTLAIELGPFGITVNSVAPGFIATAMTDATARRVGREPAEYRAEAAATTPLRRVGEVKDIAGVIAFLASESASFVTGQTIYVDGGLSL